MKFIYQILIVISSFNCAYSQTTPIDSLVKETKHMKLDMWELTDYAQKHLKNHEQLAKFFYYWMRNNIKYDYEYLDKMDKNSNDYEQKQDELRVYEDRKGVCGGYANLFSWFMREVGIEVEYIIGHIRDERNHYVELMTDDDYLHAWNAIKLNGKWILVDATWGASDGSNAVEFYFNMKPELAIISHFPKNPKWQLLKHPVSLKEFNESKFVQPIWFYEGFSEIPKLMADENYYYFVFRKNPNKEWLVGLQFSTDNINFNPVPNIDVITKENYEYFKFKKSLISKPAYFKVKIGKVKIINNEIIKHEIDNVINFKI